MITSGDQLKSVYTCLISGASKLLSPVTAADGGQRDSDDESVDLEIQQPQVSSNPWFYVVLYLISLLLLRNWDLYFSLQQNC